MSDKFTYVRHSPSALNLFSSQPSMFVLERIVGKRQPMGVPAHRGSAVEEGLAIGLFNPDASLDDCVTVANKKYDTLTALLGDARREKYRESMVPMIETALSELRPYGVPTKTQGFVEWRPDGLKYPVVGYYDFYWEDHGIIVDLKTTEKMPSEIKIPHARQVALYAAAISDNIDARLTYCTPKKVITYQLENVREHRNSLYQIALRCEAFLALSDDPSFFTSIIVPDLESFYWGSPTARQMAFEIWGI